MTAPTVGRCGWAEAGEVDAPHLRSRFDGVTDIYQEPATFLQKVDLR